MYYMDYISLDLQNELLSHRITYWYLESIKSFTGAKESIPKLLIMINNHDIYYQRHFAS